MNRPGFRRVSDLPQVSFPSRVLNSGGLVGERQLEFDTTKKPSGPANTGDNGSACDEAVVELQPVIWRRR